MSLEATKWAWKQEIPYKHKIVLLALADFANEKNECWPGHTFLSKKCGMTRVSVTRSIGFLKETTLIKVFDRSSKDSEKTLRVKRLKTNRFFTENNPESGIRRIHTKVYDVYQVCIRGIPGMYKTYTGYVYDVYADTITDTITDTGLYTRKIISLDSNPVTPFMEAQAKEFLERGI